MNYSYPKLLIACLLSKSAFSDESTKRGNLREGIGRSFENTVEEPWFDGEVKNEGEYSIMDFFQTASSFFREEDSEGGKTRDSNPFAGVFGGASGSFSSSFQSFSQNGEGAYDSYTVKTEKRSGGDEEEPLTVRIEEHGETGEGGETEVTKKTTKIYADGHSSEDVETKTLEKDASFVEIFDAYKDIINDVTPQVADLSKITNHKIEDVINQAVSLFWEQADGVDEEEILDTCGMSKEELINDFDNFNEAYAELGNKEDIKNDPETAEKFDKLTDNFSKIVRFSL